MSRKKLYIVLVFILLISIRVNAQIVDDPGDPGGDIPIPGILYFLVALLGIGLKKIYNARKKD